MSHLALPVVHGTRPPCPSSTRSTPGSIEVFPGRRSRQPATIGLALLLIASQACAADAPAVRELMGLSPRLAWMKNAVGARPAPAPAVVKTREAAGEIFDAEQLGLLLKEVDFETQIVLIFCWGGSGGDRVSFDVAEGKPEKVSFTVTRGRSRDLRGHVQVYALEKDVPWKVIDGDEKTDKTGE